MLEILEVWSPREFQLATCCDLLHEEKAQVLATDPRATAALLRGLGLEALSGQKVRRVVDASGQLLLDWHPAGAQCVLGQRP